MEANVIPLSMPLAHDSGTGKFELAVFIQFGLPDPSASQQDCMFRHVTLLYKCPRTHGVVSRKLCVHGFLPVFREGARHGLFERLRFEGGGGFPGQALH